MGISTIPEGSLSLHWIPQPAVRIQFGLLREVAGYTCGRFNPAPAQVFDPGEWIHMTAVADRGETAIYRNGEYIRCDEYNGPTGHGCQSHGERIDPMPGNAPLRLGTRDLKSFFQGGLSKVRIWNRALQREEIRKLYASDVVSRHGLAAEFPLDEGKGEVVHDSTGKHQGRVVGANWVKLASK